MGKNTVNSNEPRDTYLVRIIIIIAAIPANRMGINANAINIPTIVAIPLPPRKRNHTGQLCPAITAMPQTTEIQ